MTNPGAGDALLVVDVQNDFCPGGALPVMEGDAVVDVINRISRRFPVAAACQDWHPEGHVSFAASHPGKNPFDVVRLGETEQVLWPKHCVQGTHGADFHPRLDQSVFRGVVRKGVNRRQDSYSAFLENDRKTPTGMAGLLRELGIRRVFIVGLATDYCVLFSALDGRDAGFEMKILEDACRGVDVPPGNVQKALDEMRQRGIEILQTSDLRSN